MDWWFAGIGCAVSGGDERVRTKYIHSFRPGKSPDLPEVRSFRSSGGQKELLPPHIVALHVVIGDVATSSLK